MTLSATVVLRPADGRDLTGDERITSANLREYLPSDDAVATARSWFEGAGFDVGPVVGIGFSITAPRARFEEVFGAVPDGEELPLERVPPHVRRVLASVTFSPPPDFGPTSFSA